MCVCLYFSGGEGELGEKRLKIARPHAFPRLLRGSRSLVFKCPGLETREPSYVVGGLHPFGSHASRSRLCPGALRARPEWQDEGICERRCLGLDGNRATSKWDSQCQGYPWEGIWVLAISWPIAPMVFTCFCLCTALAAWLASVLVPSQAWSDWDCRVRGWPQWMLA